MPSIPHSVSVLCLGSGRRAKGLPGLQVWAEVGHCEERVQLLCTIARAVETHVSILQDELCKVGGVPSPCSPVSISSANRCIAETLYTSLALTGQGPHGVSQEYHQGAPSVSG